MDNQTLFASAQLGGPAAVPGDEKPAVVISGPALALGINAQRANGIDNFNTKGILGSDLFAAPSEGGHAMLKVSSKPNEGNWMDKLRKKMSADMSRINAENAPKGSSGNSGSTSSGGSTNASASSGGGTSGSSSIRGGSADKGLSSAIAQLSGISIRAEHFDLSQTADVPVDYTPARVAPVVAPAPEPEAHSL